MGMQRLKNKIVAITRSEYDSTEFSHIVRKEGGRPMALPTIEVVPKGQEAAKEFIEKLQTKKHEYCVFMSPQAVRVLFELIGEEALPLLKSTTVIALGPKTKQALEERGVKVGMVPEKFSSPGLIDLLSSIKPTGKKIIIPRSGAANESFANALNRFGMEVDEIFLYAIRTNAVTPLWHEFADLLSRKKVDALIFTSGSNVSSFFDMTDRVFEGELELDNLTKVVSIGPLTSKELGKRSIKFYEAQEHTILGTLKVVMKLM